VGEPESANGGHEIAFEAFGVRLAVSANRPELVRRIRAYLPPGWRSCPPSAVERRFALTVEEMGTCRITRDGELISGGQGLDPDLALELLDSQLRLYLGRKAPDAIFVHAGVVAHRARAIVMPATSFSGKTMLVAALIRAGAIYFSDEFAVLDRDGRVHPYAKPLSIREDGWAQTDHPVAAFGGTAGEQALPVGAIVLTSYRPDAEWSPRRLSPGEGALALLANAVPARERPVEVMRATSRAAKDALVIQSVRGEADAVAPLLLAELERLNI
jgi:hypothetical protein